MAESKRAVYSIFEEAKRLRAKYPNKFSSWREYVAQASAIYASKHKGKSPIGRKGAVARKIKNVVHKAKRQNVGSEKENVRRSLGATSVGKLTKKRLVEMLKREKLRLRNGYELAKRVRVSGVIGYLSEREIADLIKHYMHVLSRIEQMILKSDNTREKRELEGKLITVKRHIEWLNDFYKKIKK